MPALLIFLDSNDNNRPTEIIEDETAINVAQKLINAQIFNVVVTDGEPLIKQSLTKRILRMLSEAGIHAELNSNNSSLVYKIYATARTP